MKRCRILGINFCVTDLEEVSDYIIASAESLSGEYISLCNVHTTVMAMEDPSYRKAENGAALTLPDGNPIAAEQRKRGFPEAQRTGGPDLMEIMFKKTSGNNNKLRHFFYGSTPETIRALTKALSRKYPGIQIAGSISPPFRELSEKEDQKITEKIRAASPDIIWVGLGAPKQEKWMAAHKGSFDAVMIGVGAGFDFHAGVRKRAPEWMQRIGLEWLYRLLQEPGRLFSRYFHSNTKFLLNVVRDRAGSRTRQK